MPQHSNRLIKETSPYLLQHAHNPVDWHPWGEEAFEKAANQDKPVLVSIGYAACHWCHVMERESFENEGVAQLMNENFINIKVDREERPDVDHIYMDAVQAISGSGGWPLNVFLTPDRKPFYGGTYFPPQKSFNRASWTETLLFISKTYKERKDEVIAQAQTLIDHIQASNNFGTVSNSENIFQLSNIDAAFQQVMNAADKTWGGFGKAPKFPQTFTIHFLLQYGHTRKNEDARKQALLSLDKMIAGGIYDQVGGGFSRYSTDNEWLAPHFEKMLYDNALLIFTLSDAYLVTGKPKYREVISKTLSFIERELSHSSGGFYSALDADSEGVEGKFYVWDYKEVLQLLGDKAELFCSYYNITTSGNWEGKNIPRVLKSMEDFAKDGGYDLEELKATVESGIHILFQEREKRIRPQLDDKVILGWNALMNSAYCKAFAATAEVHYRDIAVQHMEFMLTAFRTKNDLFHHTWKDGQANYPAFLDDYSYLITALLDLLEVTANLRYLDIAKDLTQLVIDHFGDNDTAYFFYTNKDQKDIPLRKKEMYDGAMPSGNSTMAYNLYRLSIYLDRVSWRERSASMMGSIGATVCKYPTSFGVWLSLLFEMIHGTTEVVIIGKNAENYLGKILGIFISHRLILASQRTDPAYPLLADKAENDEILIYLCENYACKRPVSTIQDFVSLLNSN